MPPVKSFLRPVGGRKKKRCLGSVAVVDREEFEGMELDGKVEMNQNLTEQTGQGGRWGLACGFPVQVTVPLLP